MNQYVVVKTLGQGAYGKVKLCLNSEDHNLYALKLVSKVSILCTPGLPPLCQAIYVILLMKCRQPSTAQVTAPRCCLTNVC